MPGLVAAMEHLPCVSLGIGIDCLHAHRSDRFAGGGGGDGPGYPSAAIERSGHCDIDSGSHSPYKDLDRQRSFTARTISVPSLLLLKMPTILDTDKVRSGFQQLDHVLAGLVDPNMRARHCTRGDTMGAHAQQRDGEASPGVGDRT